MPFLRYAAATLAAVVTTALLWSGQTTDDHGDAAAAAAQQVLAQQVLPAPRIRRAHPVASPASHGAALAVMRIPRFGGSWKWIVSEGVDDAVIADGPGHFPGTALPGARGNSAYAAHRAGHGDPFIDFDLLRPGDRVFLSQGRTTWTYAITTAPRIIEVTDVWVLDPLPGRMLTLTTCWPKYGSAKRMFVRGTLVDVTVTPTAG